jgi:type II secretory pathway pseudopilin PulG
MELLVVISIIGLLSSVILPSLTGARIKADNAQGNRVVEEYTNALSLAYDANGEYPNPGNTTTSYCLGDYPVLGVYTDTSVCGPILIGLDENQTIHDALAPFLNEFPTMKTVYSGSSKFIGPSYKCEQPSGTTCTKARVTWHLKGTQTCARGAAATLIGTVGTTCTLYLE